MGSEAETKKEIKRHLRFIALAVALLLIFVPIGCEVAYRAGLLPQSPVGALLDAFGADATEDKTEFVEFFSVGQGDCTIIKSRDMAAVIDFGLPDETDALYDRLKQLGIDRLDLAVVTHHQQDHMGGLLDLYEHMEIDRLLIGKTSADDGDDALYTQVVEAAEAAGTILYSPVAGGKYQIGDAMLEVLFADETAESENNRSIVTRLTIGNKRVLFTGDLEASGEKKLMQAVADLDCDIFKLGHHGSNTSNSTAFLKCITPKIAVASSGYDHIYGHPADAVVERLTELGITLYRTDLDKTIRCTFAEKSFTVLTEREDFE